MSPQWQDPVYFMLFDPCPVSHAENQHERYERSSKMLERVSTDYATKRKNLLIKMLEQLGQDVETDRNPEEVYRIECRAE